MLGAMRKWVMVLIVLVIFYLVGRGLLILISPFTNILHNLGGGR